MNGLSLARRFLRWRAVTTWLLVLSIALAVGIVVALRSLPRAIGAGAVEPAARFPVLVGRAESASRLVLSTVFLEPPAPPAMPRSVLDRARAVPGVAGTVPIRIEHDGGHPIVSTMRTYFRLAEGRLVLARGRFFQDGEMGTVVVGSRVAAEEQVAAGDTIPSPGSGLRVVGVLAETGTTLDNSVFTALSPDDGPLSAIVVLPAEGFHVIDLTEALRDQAVLAFHVEPVLRGLLRRVAAVEDLVTWLSSGIAALTAALIFSSLYSGARERSRDLAVLRVIGARRSTIVSVIIWEAAIVGMVGSLLGLLAADVILSRATSVLSSAGFAFTANVGTDGLRVAGAGTILALIAGLAVGSSVYRIEPARTLEGVHRPWPEVLGPKGRGRLRRVMLAMGLVLLLLPSSTYVPSPRSRELNPASVQFFRLLWQWNGEGSAPAALTALQGRVVEVEGFQYLPIENIGRRNWTSAFFLVRSDPNRPEELFHDDAGHHAALNERVWVELEEPIEPTLYPIHVTGTFTIRRGRTPFGEALYRIVGARARAIVLETD